MTQQESSCARQAEPSLGLPPAPRESQPPLPGGHIPTDKLRVLGSQASAETTEPAHISRLKDQRLSEPLSHPGSQEVVQKDS